LIHVGAVEIETGDKCVHAPKSELSVMRRAPQDTNELV